ncbi:hypothetical protein FOZ63_023352 [Perkinsus olseni]|uniref:Uncharacterized protein n=1 Tax=Perkinsus olseni TaxID=32597 RepID=A0A7J6QFU1_PEROL|nr:hypothetical protein FOZ63_023352 [Perkinsus olseni]KAF4719083.1 hypothetical protein FOZ62_027308 [Perkinsus olseni]
MARSSDIPRIDFHVASGKIETHPSHNGKKIHGLATVTVILRSLMVASHAFTLAIVPVTAMALRTSSQNNGKILSTPETCMATYPEGSLTVFEPSIPEGKAVSWDSKDKKKGVMYWVEGRPQKVGNIFHGVFPFARSIETILNEFHFGMTEDQCVSLINEIEKNYPEGSNGKGNWIKTFVEDNMAAAMELAKKHGTYEDLAA